MSIEKKIITWKEADRKLCTLAASMINEAMAMRLTEEGWRDEYAGQEWSLEKDEVPLTGEDTQGTQYPPGIWDRSGKTIWARGDLSPQCFYSFTNLVRIHLKQSRLMLYRNLFGKGNPARGSKQRSRNPEGRGGSK